MKKNGMSKTILAITLIAIIGIGGTAFAHRQGGGQGCPGYANNGQQGGQGCPGYGYGGQQGRGGQGYMLEGLSEEDQAKINELRQKHFEATQALRSERDSKRLALKSELTKQNPDPQAAAGLQAELSDLNAQLGQKRIEHIIEMKKINPNAGRGFMMGAGSGKGRGKGDNRGYGCGNRW